MISFIAQAAADAGSDSPFTSCPINAGHDGVSSITSPRGCGEIWLSGRRCCVGACPGPHQAGQRLRQCGGIDGVADHRVSTGPGGEPPVVWTADDQEHGRAVVYLVLGLAANPPAPRRLRLAVKHHDVGSASIEQSYKRRVSGNFDQLNLWHIGCGTTADGQPDPRAGVRVMAIHDNFHNWMLPT